MIGFRVATENVKRLFFDAPAVLGRVSRARIRVLSRAGAFLRQTARNLIRSGKGASQPGKPPKSHTGILKRWILFSFDPATQGLVVGPAKTNQVFFDGAGKPTTGTVPEVLEYGGEIGVLESWLPTQQKWVRADLRSKRRLAGRKTRIRHIKIAARPYMATALEKESDKLPDLWADTIRPAA